jgi:mannosyltransferase
LTQNLRAALQSLVLIGAATGFFLVGLRQEHLWFDEIFSATFSRQSVFDLTVSTLRFDVHPPLYYLQLKLWALLGSSDYWLLLNSVFWSVLAACSVVGLRFFPMSRFEGNVAGLLFALMPGTVLYAHFVRMYAMDTCLTIWLAMAVRSATGTMRARYPLFALIALELALLYSNGAAPVIVICAASFGFLLLLERGASTRDLTWWLAVHVMVGILAIPAVANSFLHSTEHPIVPTFWDVPNTIVGLYAGPLSGNSAIYAATLVLFAVTLTYGLVSKSSRSLTVAFIVLPFLLVWSVSHLGRPIWLPRVFLFTMPFFAIILTSGVFELSHRISTSPLSFRLCAGTILAGLGIVWCIMRFADTGYFAKSTNYAAIAAVISGNLRPGDVVYVPENVSFWGIARYLDGPDWGSPLAVQDPLKPDFSERWKSLLAKLGPAWRTRLHLEPQKRTIMANGLPLVVGWSPPEVGSARRVWLVTHEPGRADEIPPRLYGFTEVNQTAIPGLMVHLLARSNVVGQ